MLRRATIANTTRPTALKVKKIPFRERIPYGDSQFVQKGYVVNVWLISALAPPFAPPCLSLEWRANLVLHGLCCHVVFVFVTELFVAEHHKR